MSCFRPLSRAFLNLQFLCFVLAYAYLTIILRNRAEYHLILSRRGRRSSWLNQGIFRKIEQVNCFIIQQIPIDYHFHNEKNYGSMIKTLKASNTWSLIKIKTELQEIEVYYRWLKKTYLQTHIGNDKTKKKKYCYLTEISPLPVN